MCVQYVPKPTLIPAVFTSIEIFTEEKSSFLPRLFIVMYKKMLSNLYKFKLINHLPHIT